jgi:ferredoxin
MSAFILEKLCRGCKRCVNACTEEAITMLSQLAIVDPVKCVECEACMEACMHGAITFVEMGVKKTNGG